MRGEAGGTLTRVAVATCAIATAIVPACVDTTDLASDSPGSSGGGPPTCGAQTCAVEVIVPLEKGPTNLALVDGRLYWLGSCGNAVKSRPANGDGAATVTTIATPVSPAMSLSAGGGAVWYGDKDGLWRAVDPPTGASPTLFAPNMEVWGVAFATNQVYWGSHFDHKIRRCTADNCSAPTDVFDTDRVSRIHKFGNELLATRADQFSTVWRVDLTTNATNEVAHPTQGGAVFSDGTRVYFGDCSESVCSVKSALPSGAQAVVVVSNLPSHVNGLFGFADDLYYTLGGTNEEKHSNGELRRVHKDGTGDVVLAKDRPNPSDVVVTADGVFWLEVGVSENTATCVGTDAAVLRMKR